MTNQLIQHTVNTPYPVGPVHLYTAECNGELVLFDTGPPTKECRQYLESQIDIQRLKYLFVTHCHPDHYGQISWLEEKGVVPIVSQYDVWKFVNIDERSHVLAEVLRGLGVPQKETEEIRQTIRQFQLSIPFAKNYRILEESHDLLDELGIDYRRCAGHSQSDIVYLVNNQAISGDVLLLDIFQTPLLEVDFTDMKGRFSNYRFYCRTICELARLQGHTFKPGHRISIDSVKERIAFYLEKIEERSRIIEPMVAESSSFEIMTRVLPDVDTSSFLGYLKLSEVAFLVDYLVDPKLLKSAWRGAFPSMVKS